MSPAAWGGSPVPALAGLDGLEPRTRPDATPFIGLVLIVLITCMVITPAIGHYQGPRARTAEVRPNVMPTLGIDLDGRYYVDDRPVPDIRLAEALRAVMAAAGGDELLIKADEDVAYARVEGALQVLRRAGVRRVMIDAVLPRPRAAVAIPLPLDK
jgi:biopolymer transport protein ExbD